MMDQEPQIFKKIIDTYQKRAAQYDSIVIFFNLFRPFGFDIPAWRLEAVRALELKPGDQVVDIGCGTGLNFALLYEAIGPTGKITGVDLSDAMLAQARKRTFENGWQNVELVCADAAQYEYPAAVDGVLSTFALTLVPACGQAVANGCQALHPGGHLSVLDMAWPTGWSLGWRHVLFFLRSYGVTREILVRQPWKEVWKTMDAYLADITRKRFWYGFTYLASGVHQK